MPLNNPNLIPPIAGVPSAADVVVDQRLTADLVSNMYARWRIDDVSGVDGDAISSVTDGSGNSRTLSASAGEEPTLKVGEANNRRCLRFPSGKQMSYTPGVTLAVPHTVFIVCRFSKSASVYRYALGSPYFLFARTTGDVALGVGVEPTGAGDANLAVWTVKVTASGESLWRNGTPLRGASGYSPSLTKVTIGGDGSGTFKNFDSGDVYEVLIYSSALADYERSAIEAELCGYYGIKYAPRGVAPTLTSTTANGQNVKVWTPVDFVSGAPHPVLFVSHGGAQSETVTTATETVRVVDAALQMGWVVCSSNEGSGGSWRAGSSDALADCDALLSYIRSSVCPIERIVTLGVSYGGQSSLHNLRRWNKAVGWVGIAAVCDSSAGPTSPSSVSNPMTDPVSYWTGKRFLFIASASDSIVSQSSHSTAMAARATLGSAAEVSTLTVTGDHIDSSHYQPLIVGQFLERCRRMEVPER